MVLACGCEKVTQTGRIAWFSRVRKVISLGWGTHCGPLRLNPFGCTMAASMRRKRVTGSPRVEKDPILSGDGV